MLNRSEILTSAWIDYRRDVLKGWGVRRGPPFNRRHFAYCLRTAWAVAKDQAAKVIASEARRQELIREAGMLNNHAEPVSVDHVTIMGMMDTAECERHVAKLRTMTKPKPPAAVTVRAEAIRSELLDMQKGDFIPWARHAALSSELARLSNPPNTKDFSNHPFTSKPNIPVRAAAGGLSNDHHRKHTHPPRATHWRRRNRIDCRHGNCAGINRPISRCEPYCR
ncbi:MAG: hypothetical protein ABS76_14320 [Pelagibacterium sp. SCN 64-44]|nr:MAG: hypothetical protein ABS76_14320 [Pelagibacterium sp. SCN 64-44]